MDDTSSSHCSAEPQFQSPFFTVLPAEIRNLIYAEFWKLYSARQHIVKRQIRGETDPEVDLENFTEQWLHVPCLVDPSAEDIRWSKYINSSPSSEDRRIWGNRLRSEWCLHWACEEQLQSQDRTGPAEVASNKEACVAPKSQPAHGRSGILDLLLTCKRIYLESLPSLYSSTTFILTDTRTAGEFLACYGTDAERYPLRSLELCIRLPNLLTEIYYPPAVPGLDDEGPPAVFAGRARPTVSVRNNPWQRLCDALVALPTPLHDLRIWLDSSDLRPWHKRVSETRFFARLSDVRGLDKARFVLSLPELPERRGPDSHALQEHYLENDKLDDVPFTVERGRRPNNWRVHLRNIVNFSAAALPLQPNATGPVYPVPPPEA
ncbi:hypothetical protein VTI28DRAFT_2415 [Corynascus sepedonium]